MTVLKMDTLAQIDANAECRRTKQVHGLVAGPVAHEAALAARASLEVRRAAMRTLFEQDRCLQEEELHKLGLAFQKDRF